MFCFEILQSAESKDQKTTFMSEKSSHQTRRASTNDDAMKSRLSEDESNDSAFADNGKNHFIRFTLFVELDFYFGSKI